MNLAHRAERRNVWACFWECNSKSAKGRRGSKQIGNAIEERRFIVTATIAAFPTVPLLQRVGILYRRPLTAPNDTKTVFHIWAKEGHMHTYTLSTHTHSPHVHTLNVLTLGI